MRNRDLDRLLRGTHAAEPPADDPARDALRDELVARYRGTHPRNRRWKIMTHRIWFRPALAAVIALALGIAACTTPTSYDVDMGQKLTLSFEGAAKSDATYTAQRVADWLGGYRGVEGVSMGLKEIAEGPLTADLTVWGQKLDGDALRADLQAEFPDLDNATISVVPLQGSVEGSLADAMGHSVLGLEISGETAEQVRQEIMEQLEAQGFDGDAQVEVVDEDDGRRTINVELNDVQTNAAAGGQAVIELKGDADGGKAPDD